ncbi:hypothetical protein EJB05_43582, partial [Eragrostis curvula]
MPQNATSPVSMAAQEVDQIAMVKKTMQMSISSFGMAVAGRERVHTYCKDSQMARKRRSTLVDLSSSSDEDDSDFVEDSGLKFHNERSSRPFCSEFGHDSESSESEDFVEALYHR